MDALAFLEIRKAAEPQPVYVLHGAERLLKRQALARIQALVLGEGGDDFARSTYDGESVEFATVRDELETLPFLSSRRLVVVNDADTFVTKYRENLEKYVARHGGSGVLVLDVKSWKSNTRLAKALPDAASIACGVPERGAVQWARGWVAKWAVSQYARKLDAAAAGSLVDLVGTDLGVLDQEVAKLSVYVGDAGQITAADVDRLVSNRREETVWRIFDAIGQGNTREAMGILHSLFDQGQEPVAILGAMGWQLRRLASAARLQQQGTSLGAAVSKVGLFRHDQAEALLRHLGRRAFQLFDWLLEADLGVKSSDRLPPRTVLERLVVKLAVRA